MLVGILHFFLHKLLEMHYWCKSTLIELCQHYVLYFLIFLMQVLSQLKNLIRQTLFKHGLINC